MIDRGILIKPTKRKHSVSGYECFDIYDYKGNIISGDETDVIIIDIGYKDIMLEIVDGMVHIWSHQNLEVKWCSDTLLMELNDKEN